MGKVGTHKIGGDGDGRCHSDLLRDSWADGSSESSENKPGHMDRFKKRKKKGKKGGEKTVELNKNKLGDGDR